MSYLADAKAELRAIYEDAFKRTWERVERQLKASYKNGLRAGQKGAGAEKEEARNAE